MKVAIVGATGTAGALTAAVAKNRGHEVVEISRSAGVDLHTGGGLTHALADAVAVIDTSNPVPTSTSTSDDVVGAMSGATRHLVEACTAAGVEHVVFLSISNIDKPELDQFPYYLAKREQERIVRDSPPVGHHRSFDAVVRIRDQPVSVCRDRGRGGSPGLVDPADRRPRCS